MTDRRRWNVSSGDAALLAGRATVTQLGSSISPVDPLGQLLH
jgi:hypothetical protein